MRSRCMTKFDFAKHFRYLFLANLDGIDFGVFDFRFFEQFCSAFGLFVSCFFGGDVEQQMVLGTERDEQQIGLYVFFSFQMGVLLPRGRSQ